MVLNAAVAGTGAFFGFYRAQARVTAPVRQVSCLPAAALHERPARGRAFTPLAIRYIDLLIERKNEGHVSYVLSLQSIAIK